MNIDLISIMSGLGIGAILTWLIYSAIAKSINAELKTQLALLSEKLKTANQDLEMVNNKFNETNKQLSQTKDDLSMSLAKFESAMETIKKNEDELKLKKIEGIENNKMLSEYNGIIQNLRAKNESAEEKLKDLKKDIEETRKTFELEFKNMAQTILDEKTEKFTELNKINLDAILKPLSENIKEFKLKVEETYDKESKERFSLGDRVKELLELNHKISKEANDLTKALKGDSKVQGDWGEIILERILEKSGLQKGREYTIQESFKDENGQSQRTDVVLTYPDDRKVVIDSKVSLTAYEKYANSDEIIEQRQFLKEHIRSLKTHIDSLSNKRYDELVKSLDFTMMFIPIEPAYLVAVKEDEDLWHYAYNKRILLISPTHLVSAIKMIADLWKREDQNRNAEEIAKRGGLLYDKFKGFIDNMEKLGRNIENADKAFNEAMGQLKTGKGNLISQADALKKLGANTSKNIETNDAQLEESKSINII